MNKKLSLEELNRLTVDAYKSSNKRPITIVLDNIRSLNNIGSIFRAADAFRIARIFLCGITAQPPHREIQKTALGATNSVDWQYFETTKEAVKYLKKEGVYVVSAEQAEGSQTLKTFKVESSSIAIVLGNEVMGVDQEIIDMSDKVIEIEQFGTKHSLNIANTAAIFMWQIQQFFDV